MEDTDMKKKYMKPEMEVVKIQQQCQILAGSSQGVNDTLQDEEVEDGWARELFTDDEFNW